jgi:hypothetical protein
MPSIQPPLFEWHDLPCTPYNGNRVFSIFVPESETDQTKVVPVIGTGPNDPETTWQTSPDWVRSVQAVNAGLRDYVLRMHQKAGRGRLFFYGKKLTAEELRTPYRKTFERRQQFWPTVLLKLWFDKVTVDVGGKPQDQVFDHAKYREGQTYPTVFQTNFYQSDTQWLKARFSRLFPLTDTIKWAFPSNQGSFPECLHPLCTFPGSTDSTRAQVFGAGTPEIEIGGDYVKEIFPATSMQDWEKYTVEITKSEAFGMYDYAETVALPPIDDREVTV